MSASSHRIILLNFTEAEANAVAKAGYKVDRGIIGSPDQEDKYCPFQVPHPLYEYDVLFYNSQLSRSPELQSQLTNPINLFRETGSFNALRDLNLHPRVRVAFTGGDTGVPHLTLGGIPFAKLIDAERDVSAFVEHKGYTFSIEKLHRLIAGFRNQIAGVSQFFSVPQNNYPFSHETVLTSRIGQQVAGYGTTYENETFPRYVILPQLKDFSRAIIEILQCLESVWPQLFPDRVQQGWINAAEFLLPEEKAIEAEIQEVIAVATHAVEEKERI